MVYNYDRYESFLGQKKEPGPKNNQGGDHFLNFITAVRTHDKKILNAPVETAHLASGLAHLVLQGNHLRFRIKFNLIDSVSFNYLIPLPPSPGGEGG